MSYRSKAFVSAKSSAPSRFARPKPHDLKRAAEIDALNARALEQLQINPPNALATAEMARYASQKSNYLNGLAQSLSIAAQCHSRLSNYADAEPLFIEAYELSQKIRNRFLEAEMLNAFGLMRAHQGDYADAMRLCKQGLDIAISIGDEKNQAAALTAIGIAYWNLGDYENALDHKRNALALTRQIGDRAREAQLLTNIGTVYNQLGDHNGALKFHLECLDLSRTVHDPMRESVSLNNLTFTYWQLGDVKRSLEAQQACLEIKRKIGDRRGEALSLINLAEIEEHQARKTEAEELWQTALQILRDIGDKHNEARCLYSLAMFQLKAKRFSEAASLLELALIRATSADAKPEQAEILAALAELYEQTGETGKALEHYKQSFALEKELLHTKAAQKLKSLQAQFEVEQAKRENERLKQELEWKRRSLQVSALAITNKNEMLKAIRKEIIAARQETGKKTRDRLMSNLVAFIDSKVDSERAWSLFEKELSLLNPDVMQRLANRFPELSPQELKICSMLREDIKTKQIALLLNLSPRTIEKHRENIRRTFQLDKEQSLSAFLASI